MGGNRKKNKKHQSKTTNNSKNQQEVQNLIQSNISNSPITEETSEIKPLDKHSFCFTLTLPTVIESEIQKFSSHVLTGVQDLCSPLLKDNNPEFLAKYTEFQQHLNYDLKIYLDASKTFRKDFDTMLETNRLLIEKINNPSAPSNSNNDKIKKVNAETQTDMITSQTLHKFTNTELNTTSTPHAHKTANTESNLTSPLNFNKSLSFTSNPPKYHKISIQNIPVNVTESEIISAINNTTQTPLSSIKFVSKSKLKFTNNFNFVFNIPFQDATELVKRKSIEINSTTYIIVPFIQVIRCENCQRFGHNINNCMNVKACVICSMSHNGKDCKETPICVNCKFYNQRKGTNFNINHPSSSKICKSLKIYINKQRQFFL